ncbi:hypothetical protein [Limnofasciculus baicalensis]|uniref:Cytochrome c family protein n=1 Tax=Limnofasciculus baicalensis BBK-W-15 TaxID=2699891 RepID=A0AAE3KL53_9CYAN|nr:hypothetical protein [Limnofasciculus baicalensis]MCP2727724.1 hypothetical protein [Limnofasciculus baicalensis BBK-W-15]
MIGQFNITGKQVKLTQRLIAILSVILACVVGGGLLVLPAPEARAQFDNGAKQPEIKTETFLNPTIPANPSRGVTPPEKAFGQFAWQTFVALNWPANCDGSPLKILIGQDPTAPRVWEFYNSPDQIFLPNGQDPSPVIPVVPPACKTPDTQTQRLDLQLSEVEGEIENTKESVFKTNILLPGGKPLIDQTGNYVLNEIRMNPMEVKQIVDWKWYSADNLQNFNNNVNFPNDAKANPFALVCSDKSQGGIYEKTFPCRDNQDVGAIEIKSAWRVLPNPIPPEIESKYYTTNRTFLVEPAQKSADGKEKEVTVPVALIGFHIIQKTSKQGWTWATFEHLDNAPDTGTKPDPKTDYILYNPNCKGQCEENKSYAKSPYLWRDEFPHAATKDGEGFKAQTPSQITRLIPITGTAESLNSEWQGELRKINPDSIWQNYQLIGTQWLGVPYNPYNNSLRDVQPNPPRELANVTLEPYFQTEPIGSSCIACHTQAYLPKPNENTYADFSFLLNNAQSLSNSANVK